MHPANIYRAFITGQALAKMLPIQGNGAVMVPNLTKFNIWWDVIIQWCLKITYLVQRLSSWLDDRISWE